MATQPGDANVKAATDAAKLREAEANAAKAASDAQLASLKAAIGEPTTSAYDGKVTADEGAALAEMGVLVQKSLNVLAKETAKAILAEGGISKVVLLSSSPTFPSIANAKAFDLREQLVSSMLTKAISLSKELEPPRPAAPQGVAMIFAPVAAAGLILSGANTLLGFFRSDTTLGGRKVDVVQRPFLLAVASVLIAEGAKVWIDGSPPAAEAALRDELVKRVEELSQLASDARLRSANHAKQIAALTPAAAVPGTPAPPNPDPEGKKPLHQQAQSALDTAVAAHDTMLTGLLADSGGMPLIEKIVEEMGLQEQLAESGALWASVSVDGAAGSTVDQKNMLSSLGSHIPYKVSSLVSASWSAFDGVTGRLLGAGMLSDRNPLADIQDI